MACWGVVLFNGWSRADIVFFGIGTDITHTTAGVVAGCFVGFPLFEIFFFPLLRFLRYRTRANQGLSSSAKPTKFPPFIQSGIATTLCR